MRAEEIREMSGEDIAKRVHELEEEQFRLNFRSATEPLEDPLRLRVIRREIARLKTVLGEMRRAGESAAASGRGKGAKAAGSAKATTESPKKTAAATRKPARAARG